MSTLIFHIEGPHGGVSLESFITIMENALKVLRDLDARLSETHREELTWYVSDIRMGSLEVGLEARARKNVIDVKHMIDVRNHFLNGVEEVTGKGMWPAFFSDRSLILLQRITRQIGKNGATGLEVRGQDYQDRVVTIEPKTAVNVDRLIQPRFVSIGSVTGRLEAINIHGRSETKVYDALTNRAVSCTFPRELMEQVRMALGHRVIALGKVSRNENGDAIRVAVDQIDILREDNALPNVDALIGVDPEFTGGLSTEEYMKILRGA